MISSAMPAILASPLPVAGSSVAAVQREARVALQVERLDAPATSSRSTARRPRTASRCRRCAASRPCASWRSSCACGRRSAPARARRARARRRRIRTRKPCAPRCRVRRRRVQRDVEIDQAVRDGGPPARADRPRAGLARRAGATARRWRGARTSRAITWTGCWRRRRASRRWRCGGGCCSSARRGSCARARRRRRRRATAAGYGSLAAFSRAFARAYGAPPSAFDGRAASSRRRTASTSTRRPGC